LPVGGGVDDGVHAGAEGEVAIFVDGGHESLGAEHFDGAFASFGEAVGVEIDAIAGLKIDG
jgi:hypothetical protein